MSKVISKSDLTVLVADRTQCSKAVVKDVVDATLDVIADLAMSGYEVRLTGFGCFSQVYRKPRTTCNLPSARATVAPGKHTVKFRPYPALIRQD